MGTESVSVLGWQRSKSGSAGVEGQGNDVCFSVACQVTVWVNMYESHSEMSHKTCAVINTTEEQVTPENDSAILCLLLIRKKKVALFYFKGWFAVYNRILERCKTVWLFLLKQKQPGLSSVLIRELSYKLKCSVIYVAQTTLSKDTYSSTRKQPTSKHNWENAASASYCFPDCSILGNTLFPSGIPKLCNDHNISPKNGKSPTQGLLLFQDEGKKRAGTHPTPLPSSWLFHDLP